MKKQMVLFLLVASLGGCGTYAKRNEPELRKRASFDMKCKAESLQITEIDAFTSGVSGCGADATYIFDHIRGIWVMNTDLKKK